MLTQTQIRSRKQNSIPIERTPKVRARARKRDLKMHQVVRSLVIILAAFGLALNSQPLRVLSRADNIQDQGTQMTVQFDDQQDQLGPPLNRLYQHIKFNASQPVNTNNNISEQAPLSGGFLNLFNEMLTFNEAGRDALTRLDYFVSSNKNTNRTSDRPGNSSSSQALAPIRTTSTQTWPQKGAFNWNNKNNNSPLRQGLKPPMNNAVTSNQSVSSQAPSISMNFVSTNFVKQQEPNSRPLAGVAQAFNGLLATARYKVNKLLSKFTSPIANKLIGVNNNQVASHRLDHQSTSVINNQNESDEELGSSNRNDLVTLNSTRFLSKRDTSHENTPAQTLASAPQIQTPTQTLCLAINQNKLKQCKSIEMIVENNLRSSIPGSMLSIEENCRYVQYLLSNCWPEHLEVIRDYLSFWGETHGNKSEFQMPPKQSVNSQCPSSLLLSGPGRAEVSKTTLERVEWMWLNLCMDKSFRRDYVDNLKCLSLWNQERAKQLCNNDHRRLQAKLGASIDKQQSYPQTTDYTNRSLQQVNLGQKDKQYDNTERELESKILCCTFDVFLRCVFTQASKDCSRQGAQFVVNFMARIGNDDMKFLCNNEPRQAGSKLPALPPARTTSMMTSGLGSRRRQSERGPFIESSYCNDFRIFSALYGSHQMAAGAGSRNEAALQARRPLLSPTGGGSDSNWKAPSEYENVFYPGTTIDGNNKGASSRLSTLGTLTMLLPWIVAFSFNTFLLNMLTNFRGD